MTSGDGCTPRKSSIQILAAAALSTVALAQPQPCDRRCSLSNTCWHSVWWDKAKQRRAAGVAEGTTEACASVQEQCHLTSVSRKKGTRKWAKLSCFAWDFEILITCVEKMPNIHGCTVNMTKPVDDLRV